jgi:glycoside hydrolase family 2 sugar binding
MLEEAPRNLLLSPNPNGIPGEGFDKGAVRATVQDGELCITINGTGNCRLSIPVAPEWKSLKFTMQWKLTDVKPGDADWKNARVAMRFYGPKGGVGDWPAIFAGTGTTGWIECSRVYEIPEGATSLAFEPANFGSSGKVEFKKLTLELDEMK